LTIRSTSAWRAFSLFLYASRSLHWHLLPVLRKQAINRHTTPHVRNRKARRPRSAIGEKNTHGSELDRVRKTEEHDSKIRRYISHLAPTLPVLLTQN
jgi:hypothetical protein